MLTSVNLRAWLRRCLASSETKAARALGVVLLALGVAVCWWSSTRAGAGSDIFPLHLVGKGILQGLHVYDRAVQLEQFAHSYTIAPPAGVFYPPCTGFAMLPLAVLPASVVPMTWLLSMLIIVVLGIRSLAVFLRPGANWALIAGIVLLTASIRWGMTPLQGAPMMMGLFALFYPALIRKQYGRAAAYAAYAVAFKFTLALPFVALLVLRRRWGMAALLGVMLIALNVLGFYRIGGAIAFADYQHNIVALEALGDINTPDPWAAFSVPRLDWIYLFYGFLRNLALSRLLAPAGCAAVLVYLAWKAWRLGNDLGHRELRLFLMPLVCVSLLSVYHHHYDVALAIVPLLVAWFPPPESESKTMLGILSAPLAAMMVFVPVGAAQALLGQLPVGIGLFHLAFPLAVSLALLDSIRALKRVQYAPSGEPISALTPSTAT